jgi:hypothetical protein
MFFSLTKSLTILEWLPEAFVTIRYQNDNHSPSINMMLFFSSYFWRMVNVKNSVKTLVIIFKVTHITTHPVWRCSVLYTLIDFVAKHLLPLLQSFIMVSVSRELNLKHIYNRLHYFDDFILFLMELCLSKKGKPKWTLFFFINFILVMDHY